LPEELKKIVQRYGDVPLVRRRLNTTKKTLRDMSPVAGHHMGSAGLLWNQQDMVLLVRHQPGSAWGDLWVTPGGAARCGETPEETFLREVLEETGLEARVIDLTYVFELTVTDGVEEVTGFFFQFEGLALKGEASPGPGVREVRWFDELPENMAFREDYVEAFRRRRSMV
jgi:8-oxo-dGTP pyrophosphatase MutT (NUDIX family)